jgi:isopentenyl diphosphate isomerase/L-lactate dehydrogenase-like FMN-dependent dehydrogenase
MTSEHDAVDVAAVVKLADFEALAAERMERAAFDYIAGGAGDEITLADNIGAWRRWRLRTRVLVDVSAIDTSTTWLGMKVALPVGVAPMAFQHFAHPDAELATARAAAGAGVVMCLSTLSSRTIEQVAAAGGPRWFQLYVHRDRGVSAELVGRAQTAGYSALVVTVDLPMAGRRERDFRNALRYPQAFANFDARPPATELTEDGGPLGAVIGGFNDASLSWPDVEWLAGLSTMPVVLKGILTAEDAALAVEHGAAAIVVSNHGGRQLDRTTATIDVLPEIVDAVAGGAEVYLDGGVRRGVDVLTALGVGANGVFIGRPFFFALAAAGEAGVARALELIGLEVRNDMALLGVTAVRQVGVNFVLRPA